MFISHFKPFKNQIFHMKSVEKTINLYKLFINLYHNIKMCKFFLPNNSIR